MTSADVYGTVRFSGRRVVEGKCDNTVRFLLSFYLADDTMHIALIPEQAGARKKTNDKRKWKKSASHTFTHVHRAEESSGALYKPNKRLL